MNISGPAAVAKPEMLFYAPGDLTVTNPEQETSHGDNESSWPAISLEQNLRLLGKYTVVVPNR